MADIKIGDIAVYEDDDGKAVWEFEGKVQSDIPLDTDAQDFAGAINELKKLSEQGGGEGYLRAIIDDDASSLIIVAGNGAEDEAHSVFNYTYETFKISDVIKTQVKSGDIVTTTTKEFSARLISKLYNASEELIFRTECSSKGKIKSFYDGSGKEIFAENFDLNIGENIGITGADAPAIAWCMAKNSESSSSLTEQKEAYKAGYEDMDESAKEVIELDEDIPDGIVDYDVDLDSTLFDEDSDGVYLLFIKAPTNEKGYVHIYNDGKAIRGDGGVYGWGTVRVEVFGSGIKLNLNHSFHSGLYRTAVFKSAYSDNKDEVINGVRIVTNGVYVSTKGWGWTGENPQFRFPNWDIQEGFRCVKVTTSIPMA